MKNFDWMAPRVSTWQLVQLMPYLTEQNIAKQLARGQFDFPAVGSGRGREYRGIDILQLMVLFELSIAGLKLDLARQVWTYLSKHLIAHQDSADAVLAIIMPKDVPMVRLHPESMPMDKAHSVLFANKSFPKAFLAFRFSNLVEEVQSKLEGVRPIHTKRGRPRKLYLK